MQPFSGFRPAALLVALVLLAACQSPAPAPFTSGKWIDLSYAFDKQTVYWPTASGFRLDTVFDGHTEGGYYYSAFEYCAAEHGGTHLDAPLHFAKGKRPVDQLPVDQLIGPAIVVDVSKKALNDPDYEVSVDDFLNWEADHGPIPEGAIVLLHTGYGQFYPDREKYMGTAERGPQAVLKLHFPGLAPQAAQWLVDNRNIKAVGLDTPSIDFGQSSEFYSHRILYKQNIPGLENLNNLDQLPVKGAFVIGLPMKIAGGSGAPLRMVAWVQ